MHISTQIFTHKHKMAVEIFEYVFTLCLWLLGFFMQIKGINFLNKLKNIKVSYNKNKNI